MAASSLVAGAVSLCHLIGIFNADGGITGELTYAVKKIFFDEHCELCDITYGLSLHPKEDWVKASESIPCWIELQHRNEVSPNVAKFIHGKALPLIVKLDDATGEVSPFIDKEELGGCKGQPECLKGLILEKLKTTP